MPLRSTKDYSVGILYFILFILTIPAMNWVVMNVGTVCTAAVSYTHLTLPTNSRV